MHCPNVIKTHHPPSKYANVHIMHKPMPPRIWATKGGNQKIVDVMTTSDLTHQKSPINGCWIQFYI
jgi:hypothetical protein